MSEPSAVARPAPNTPISQGKAKNQSPNTLKIPPESTPTVARPGSPSLRKKCREHLVEKKQWEHGPDWEHVALREGKERLVRAEKYQQRPFEKEQSAPRERRKEHRADDRGGEILIPAVPVPLAAAALRAENDAAADRYLK